MLAYGTLALDKGRGSMMGAPLRNNGGPSRPRGEVIDLTNSSDDDEPSKASGLFGKAAQNLPIHPYPRQGRQNSKPKTQDPAAYATKTQPPPPGYQWVNRKHFGMPETCRLVSIADGSEYEGNSILGVNEYDNNHISNTTNKARETVNLEDEEDDEDEDNDLRLFGKRDARPDFYVRNNGNPFRQGNSKPVQDPSPAGVEEEINMIDDFDFDNFQDADEGMLLWDNSRNPFRAASPVRPVSGGHIFTPLKQHVDQEGIDGGGNLLGRQISHSPQHLPNAWAEHHIDEAAHSKFMGVGFGVPNLPGRLNGYQAYQQPQNKNIQLQDNEDVYQPLQDGPDVEDREACVEKVAEYFPGICREHLSELYDTIGTNSQALILHLVDQPSFPKAADLAKNLKRKRSDDKIKEELNNYDDPNRIVAVGPSGMRPYM
jgi:hypothetical protein